MITICFPPPKVLEGLGKSGRKKIQEEKRRNRGWKKEKNENGITGGRGK